MTFNELQKTKLKELVQQELGFYQDNTYRYNMQYERTPTRDLRETVERGNKEIEFLKGIMRELAD